MKDKWKNFIGYITTKRVFKDRQPIFSHSCIEGHVQFVQMQGKLLNVTKFLNIGNQHLATAVLRVTYKWSIYTRRIMKYVSKNLSINYLPCSVLIVKVWRCDLTSN